ncbi:hypothetical protein D3C71_1435190 [compost metagenome]
MSIPLQQMVREMECRRILAANLNFEPDSRNHPFGVDIIGDGTDSIRKKSGIGNPVPHAPLPTLTFFGIPAAVDDQITDTVALQTVGNVHDPIRRGTAPSGAEFIEYYGEFILKSRHST